MPIACLYARDMPSRRPPSQLACILGRERSLSFEPIMTTCNDTATGQNGTCCISLSSNPHHGAPWLCWPCCWPRTLSPQLRECTPPHHPDDKISGGAKLCNHQLMPGVSTCRETRARIQSVRILMLGFPSSQSPPLHPSPQNHKAPASDLTAAQTEPASLRVSSSIAAPFGSRPEPPSDRRASPLV